MSDWIKVENSLPNFNGKVIIKYIEKDDEIKERRAWYETGNRRFPEGFSLIPKYILSNIIEWKKDE